MRPLSRRALHRVGQTLCLVAAAWFLFAQALNSHAHAQQPDTGPAAVWQRVRDAGSYRFTADVVQTTIPLPMVTNVGRASKQERLHIAGQTDLDGRAMDMKVWTQGGSELDPHSGLEVKVEDDKVLMRQGAGDWQETENFVDWAAPQGDFTAFLAAAKDLSPPEPHTRNGVRFTRYTFSVNGPRFAEYVRDQMEQRLAEKGELPSGMALGLPEMYAGMTGSGELWVDARGLPLRQVIDLKFPDGADHRVEASIVIDFSDFGFAAGAAPPTHSPTRSASGVFEDARATPRTLSVILGVLLAAGFSLGVALNYRSRKVQAAVSVAVILSLVVSPVLDGVRAAAFYRRQAEQQSRQAALQAESEMSRALKQLMAEAEAGSSRPSGSEALALIQNDSGLDSDGDGYSDVQETFLGTRSTYAEPRSATEQLSAAEHFGPLVETGVDADGDGLTDYQESLLGTDPLFFDTDGDLITDTLEVQGFTYASQTWSSDPLEIDTNRDGLGDAQEWRFADANWDGDTDGAPDLFDRDNDGDGVPDSLDLSPFSNVATSFTRGSPFQLIVDNLAQRPSYIDFQLRPANPAHLQYASSVLDWPSDDAGQMQDVDGKTYYDVCRDNALAQGQNPDEKCTLTPDDNGDMKLVPMLEVEMDFDSFSIRALFEDLGPYNISRRFSADFKKVTLLVPLRLIVDDKTGANVAFGGRLYYLRGANWGAAHQVRFVWMAQALVDNACVSQSGGACTQYANNVGQPLHAYYDDWRLTGLDLREDHGVDVALVYEDPITDTNRNRDDVLQSLVMGLDANFLGGDSFIPGGYTQTFRSMRPFNIFDRFDHTAGIESGNAFRRWTLPNILSVELHSAPTNRYDHIDQALANIAMTNTVGILNSKFTTFWSPSAPITPTILIAKEEHFRALNLDVEGGGDRPGLNSLAWSGNRLTINMNGDGGNPVTTLASLKWTPYAYNNQTQKWRAAPLDGYWSEFERRHRPEIAAANPNPEVADGKMLMAQLIYLSVYAGMESVVQQGVHVMTQDWAKDDFEIAGNIGKTTNYGVQTITTLWDAAGIAAKEWRALGQLSKPPTSPGFSLAQIKSSLTQSKLSRFLRSPQVGGALLLTAVTLVTLALFLTAAIDGKGVAAQQSFKIGTAVFVGITVAYYMIIKPIIEVVRTARTITTTASTATKLYQAAKIVQPITKAATVIAVVGLIIDLGTTWGFFFYAWGSGAITPGTLAFNHAVAVAVAATFIAIVVFALAFIPVIGPIISAIIILVDIILSFFDTSLAELIAKAIHGGGPLVELRSPEEISKPSHRPPKKLVVMSDFDLQSLNTVDGLTHGAFVRVVGKVTTNAYHPVPETVYGHTGTIWNDATLKKNAFVYAFNATGATLAAPGLNARANAWQNLRTWARVTAAGYGTFDLKNGTLVDTLTSSAFTLTQGLNRRFDLYFAMAYNVAAWECWGLAVYSCAVSPDSNVQSFSGSPAATKLDLVFDVFPATLEAFYALTWDSAFAPHRDRDGDGLSAAGAPYFGNDPNDNLWDTDGDGLSDRYELQLATFGVPISTTLADSDADGLTDLQEALLGVNFLVHEDLRLGSNPGASDTDGDGLSDVSETQGWSFQYGPGKFVKATSDPALRDTDGDGLSDKAERDLHVANPTQYPFHPRVPNQAAFVGFEYRFANLHQARPVVGSAPAPYTVTLSNPLNPAYALQGTLSLTLPAQLQLVPPTLAESTPLYVAGGQAQSHVFRLNAAPAAASGPVTITNDILFTLDDRRVATGWQWGTPQRSVTPAANPDFPWFTAIAPSPAWGTPYLMATLEGANIVSGTQFGAARARVRTVSSSGVPGSPVEVDTAGSKWANAPDIACANDGKCLVVWGEPDAGSSEQNIYGAIVAPGAPVSVIVPRFAIHADGAAKSDPSAASDGANFLVAWERGSAIQAVTVSSAGAVGTIRQVNISGLAKHPDLAWVGNSYLVVFQQQAGPGANFGVNGRFMQSDGAPSGAVIAVTSATAENAEHPQTAYASVSGSALIAYRSNGADIRARTINATNGNLGLPFAIGARGTDTAIFEPRAASGADFPVGGDQTWVVSWLSRDRNGVMTLRYQALVTDTAPRAFQQFLTFPNSARVNPAGIGLACAAGGCAFTGNIPPWEDVNDVRSIFVDVNTLTPIPAPGTTLSSIQEDVGAFVDNDRPASVVENLIPGIWFVPGSAHVIQGRSTDPTSGIQQVEVSADGVNWQLASGVGTWQYLLTIPAGEGAHTLLIRATDTGGNQENPPRAFTYRADGTPPILTSDIAPNAIFRATPTVDPILGERFAFTATGTVSDPALPGGIPGSGVSSVFVNLTPNDTDWINYEFNPPTNWTVPFFLPPFDDSGTQLTDPTGQYTMTILAGDFAWNNPPGSNATTLQVPIRIDNRPPVWSADFSRLTTVVPPLPVITQPLVLSGLITETGAAIAGVASMEAAYFPADLGHSPGKWQASYFNNIAWQQPPAVADSVADVNFDWGSGSPDLQINSDNFSATWIRATTFRISGAYRFTATIDADAAVFVYVDNALILDSTSGTLSRTLHYDAGVHTLRAAYREGSGPAHVAFRLELIDPDWRPFAIDQPGASIVSSSWAYTIPTGLEGFYRLGMRGVDQLGNRDPQPFNWEVWRGQIDTAAPRAVLGIYFTGFGSTEQTHYLFSAEDFNLTETGLQSPCAPGALERFTYPTDWWRDWFNDGTRLFQVTARCSVPGFQTQAPTVQACDAHGQCTTIKATAPANPNFRTIYWSDSGGATSRIRRIGLENLPAGPQTLIANASVSTTLGLAVDRTNGHIYWVNPGAGSIQRANLSDGSNVVNITAGLSLPLGVALDVAGNKIYWTENTGGAFGYGRVSRADLNGANPTVLHDDSGFAPHPAGIAIDHDNARLYWTARSNPYALVRSNLDGTSTEFIFIFMESCLSDPGGLAIDRIADQLYWVDAGCVAPPLLDKGIYRAPIPPPSASSGRVYVIPTAPVTRTTGIGVDSPGEKVYWTSGSALWRAALDGAFVESVVTGLNAPAGVALDFNYAPIAPTATIPIFQNTPGTVVLPAYDAEDDPLTYTLITSPTFGVLSGVAPTYTYAPNLNFVGSDFFTYTVADNRGGLTAGRVDLIVQAKPGLDSAIITPTHGAVIFDSSPISVSGGAYALNFLKNLTLTVDSAVIYTTAWPPATVTDTLWATTWNPTDGLHTLESVVADHAGSVQTDTHPIQVWVDLAPPAITITPTILTTTHRLPQLDTVALRGAVTDTAGIASVQVSIGGAATQREPAAVSGGTWTYPWLVTGTIDGGVYTVSALASDVAARTAQVTDTVTVDIVPPAPVTMTLAYTSSLGARVPISAGQIITDTPISLIVEWTGSSDGGGLAAYLAGWTFSETPDPALLTSYGTTAREHAQVPGDAQILYAHLIVQDTYGNATTQTLGPVYVDSPATPDLIADLAYRGWQASGGSLIGVDREISRTLQTVPPQQLYTSWNTDTIRFTWAGANWDGDGDLFVYLDSVSGGATTAYNPYTITQPAIGLGAPVADYLLWVEDGSTARLMQWNGSSWVISTTLTSANFRLDTGINPAHTDLLIPFAWLGVSNPAATSLRMVAFATEEDRLDLWAAMPDSNPLNSLRVATPITAPVAFNLMRSYFWPSLGNVTPSAGQFVDADLRVTITPEPAGLAAGFLANDLLDVLPPGTPLDANLDGNLDVTLLFAGNLLPLGVGRVVSYNVLYENRGTAASGSATISATTRGALSFGGSPTRTITLPNIGPGVSGTLVFTATVTGALPSAELDARVDETVNGPFEWWAIQHDVDILPPSGLVISAPTAFTRLLTNTVFGVVQDPSGVPTITLQVTLLPANTVSAADCADPDPFDEQWACALPQETAAGISQVVLRAKATDGVGNVTPQFSDPITLTVDTTTPAISLDPAVEAILASGAINAATASTLVLSGTVADDYQAAGAEVCDVDEFVCNEIALTPGTTVSGTWLYPFASLQAGDGVARTIVLYGVDAAGNRSTPPLTRTYVVDTVPPLVAVTQTLASIVLSRLPTVLPPVLSGTATDGGGVAGVVVRMVAPSGGIYWTAAPLDGATWQFAPPDVGEVGDYTITLEAWDRAGNVSPAGPYRLSVTFGAFLPLIARNFTFAPGAAVYLPLVTRDSVSR